MNSEELRDLSISILDDMKGVDVIYMDVRSLTDITDYMVVCTGRSTRQVKAMAEAIAMKAKQLKLSHVHMEGDTNSEWILVDLGDVIVHIMIAAARAFYSLEDIWEPIKEIRGHSNLK